MAGLVKTYTGDLTQSIAKRIYEAALVGHEYRKDAKDIIDPEKAGVDDFKLNRGEFFGHALRAKATSWLPKRFQHQMPDLEGSDYLMRGQKRTIMSPFASPINPVPSTDIVRSTGGAIQKYTRGAINPSIVPKDAILGDMIDITPGRGRRVNPGRRFISAETGFIPDDKKNIFNKARSLFGQGVKVREEKLGKFLSAVAQSLSASLGSINKKMDEANEGVIIAKDGIAATHKQLEGTSDILESKLDAIIEALRAQSTDLAAVKDQQEIAGKEISEGQKEDLSNTLEIQKKDYDDQEIAAMQARDRAEDDRGDISDPWMEPDVQQLSLDMGPSGDGFARGGIASGPDSGYLAMLHGDEAIIPLDNNYTQGQPSAMGKERNVPFLSAEKGKGSGFPKGDNPKGMEPMLKSEANLTKVFNKTVTGGDTNVQENLGQAIQLPVKAAGLMTVGIVNKVLQKSTFGPEVGTRINQIIEPLAAAFGVSTASLSGLEQGMEARSKSDKARSKTLKRDQSTDTHNKNIFQKFVGWFTGKGGHGASVGRSGSTSNTSYNRSSSVNINKPLAKGGGGIIESIRNWFGLAKDRDHKVSPDTMMGDTINNMQNWRKRNEQYMELLSSDSISNQNNYVAYNTAFEKRAEALEPFHGLTTIAKANSLSESSMADQVLSLTSLNQPEVNVINNATTASKKPDVVHSPMAVRGHPWEDGTYTGAYEGFA